MSPRTPPDRTLDLTVSTLVAMPGAGSDGHYARRAFGPLADALGVPLVAVDPGPAGIVATCLEALDAAARSGPVIAAGVSIGGCVAVHWGARAGTDCAAVVAAAPPWAAGGSAASPAPAAAAALTTVALLEDEGLDAALAALRAGAPPWLADELTRSWTALGPHLTAHLREAATTVIPSSEDLARLAAPTALIAIADDPVHPAAVAQEWARQVHTGSMGTISFEEWAADPGTISRTALDVLVGLTTASGRAENRRGQRP
ncbi:alpha/beta hydrolase [Williamsia deligens]|uniref:Alpha/beta hydrolase n=1 Tax=Williamsia deligens TaxID=321325 RepID=A0ABW3GBG7_9NOCA|nr:alpha/beta hydrolase [Williamsia deligens]MCP2195392.1 Alpha/beta hydrolase family protein [Williamsia deligens]